MKSSILTTLLIFAIVGVGAYVLLNKFWFNKEEGKPVPNKQEASQKAQPEQPVTEPDPTPPTQPKKEDITPPIDIIDAGKKDPITPEPPVKPEPDVEEKQELIKAAESLSTDGPDTFANYLNKLGQTKDRDALLSLMTQHGYISEKQGDTLRNWYAQNDDASTTLIPVGTYIKDGKNYSRFRLETVNGNHLQLDFAESAEKKGSWTLAGITPIAADETDKGMSDADKRDSIETVENFIQSVRAGDMLTARALISGKEVSDATIAGLCMVFAEGGYKLRDKNPIRASFEEEGRAGYLVYLTGGEGTRPANVGIELFRNDDSKGWRIEAVSLDTLLDSYEQSAGAEGGRYFPIVKIPKGGDSLVLFFAFDDSQLTPRSLRQLKIVADLLKQSQKKLDISGHTDDVGTEQYNKELSLKRASAVMKALIEFGVAPGQISMKGLGKTAPRRHYAQDDNEELIDSIRAENRRAEIYLDFEN